MNQKNGAWKRVNEELWVELLEELEECKMAHIEKVLAEQAYHSSSRNFPFSREATSLCLPGAWNLPLARFPGLCELSAITQNLSGISKKQEFI